MSSLFASLGAFAWAKKDAAVSKALLPVAKHFCREYGEMLELSVNSQEKSLRLELLLKGETEPITITVDSYELLTGEEPCLRIQGVSVSREWLDALVKNFMATDRIPLPSGLAANLLKLAL